MHPAVVEKIKVGPFAQLNRDPSQTKWKGPKGVKAPFMATRIVGSLLRL